MTWLKNHWKDLLLIALVGIVFYCLGATEREASRALKFERLYLDTYRELIYAERSLELHYFEDYDTMRGWVNDWVKDKFISVTGFTENLDSLWHLLTTGDYLWVCTDISEEMVRGARRDGYLVSECLVDENKEVYGKRVSTFANHMGVLAYCMDGYYYFIEPQTSQIVMIVDRVQTEKFLEYNKLG